MFYTVYIPHTCAASFNGQLYSAGREQLSTRASGVHWSKYPTVYTVTTKRKNVWIDASNVLRSISEETRNRHEHQP